MGAAEPPLGALRRRVLPVVSAGIAFAVLIPVLGRGFVLDYDQVFAPRQSLVPDAFGIGGTLGRSVPADAVAALATAVLPGDVVQKFVLLLAFFFAAYGAGRLVPTDRTGIRVVAAISYAWTPYLAERLFIGHWPLLLTYACLPWIAKAGLAVREGEPRAWPRLVLALAPAVLTPPGGLLAAGVAIVTGGARRIRLTLGASLVLNLPWLVPTLLHEGSTLSDPDGVAAFAARPESWGPAILSVLGLGGIWNADVVPDSRAEPLAPVFALLVTGIALAGLRVLALRWGSAPARGLLLLGVGGVVLASLATFPFGESLLGWASGHVPGAGLLRDAQKWVAWWALPLTLGFALAVEAATAKLRTRQGRAWLVTAAAVMPLVLLPDLAWAGWGRLQAVRYPDDWTAVHDVLAADPRPGSVLAAPLSAFRAFTWNDERTQLDPAPRALPKPVVTEDTLYVGKRAIAGEDPVVAQVRAATSPRELSAGGVGWILVEHGTSGRLDPRWLAGATTEWTGPWLTLYRLPGDPVEPHPAWIPVLAADFLAVALTAAAASASMVRPRGAVKSGRSVSQQKE